MRVADKKKAILLRIPAALADALNEWARDELRSVNGQIEYLLREAVRQRRRKTLPQSTDDEQDDGTAPADSEASAAGEPPANNAT